MPDVREGSFWIDTAPAVDADDGPPPARADAVVVGAGLTGLAAAVLLARRGREVVVLEARTPGAVTTGNTTGKLSLLQGTVYSGILRHGGASALRAYAAANTAARAWLLAELRDAPGALAARPALTIAWSEHGVPALDRELAAMAEAGIHAERPGAAAGGAFGLPMPIAGALRMAAQAQLQPMLVLAQLADELERAGGRIVRRVRVRDAAGTADGVRLDTTRGAVLAEHAVLATGTPVVDRGLHFARVVPSRSFVVAFRVPEGVELPDGVVISVDEPVRSLRVDDGEEGRVLVVGGESHVTGRGGTTRRYLDEIAAWTRGHWPSATPITWWAAQDYVSASRLPFAEPLPGTAGRVFVTGGYGKWGMTNAVAAALRIDAEIAREAPPWAGEERGARPMAVASAIGAGAAVGGRLVAGWTSALVGPRRGDPPPEGVGRIVRDGAAPVAESTVDGVTCRVSGVCTHLGGVLRWNDAERSWDCPLHGSRFAADGAVLEGPATRDLAAAGR